MSSSPSSSSSSSAGLGARETAIAPEFEAFTPFLDVVCPVGVILGTGTISVRQCIALERHSIVRLSQSAGEDMQVLVGGVPVARGEVVIVEDSTAIRLTEITRSAPREARR